MPDEPEVLGLLALMLLHDARREARLDGAGELVLLEEQDRSLWDRARVDEGRRVLDRALPLRRTGPYQLQGAIASLHLELNRAVAVAMAQGPESGLALIEAIDGLGSYRHLHSARADLLRRLGRTNEAELAYNRALELTSQPAERGFLERRLAEVRSV